MGDLKEDLKMMADEGDTKQPLAGRNGKKSEHAQKSSFFTWFLVLAMLGAWTSVAVVWLEIVDYKDVLGHLAAYDVDGDGEFDVEDAKILLGLVSDDDRETVTVSESTDRLSEEGSGWFYEFLVFLYDIMTPFEIQGTEEEDTEEAAGMSQRQRAQGHQSTTFLRNPFLAGVPENERGTSNYLQETASEERLHIGKFCEGH